MKKTLRWFWQHKLILLGVTSVYLFTFYDTHFTSFDLVVYVIALPATVWISDQWRRALS
ncbi:hypothetical protein FAM18124_02167 [Lacticaseibacillus paracasei]|uniref:Uncharacterized protein n=2 Tax=Lacticaseibacillus paracasei TaxID=1597 RepID=A0A806LJ05_LACPA|nr:hypothetical protein AF91_11435 [Lacticaseibacillus paracasei N1115]RND53567.1 hypothetical protein FAM18121_02339 [Lacticaseibacillus paracasei]TDG90019.1 hypothetical protein C5L26_003039 [Lacticaseibacillus paracasei subsp. paracasei]RND53979.1 hypothetical protein FAM18113_01764 [Lacticaseibacillus paracasei]RND55218.1 hypothetical protein FAM18119_02335 [Lacticaseibacillus paracasei]